MANIFFLENHQDQKTQACKILECRKKKLFENKCFKGSQVCSIEWAHFKLKSQSTLMAVLVYGYTYSISGSMQVYSSFILPT